MSEREEWNQLREEAIEFFAVSELGERPEGMRGAGVEDREVRTRAVSLERDARATLALEIPGSETL
jgi:hypothetical protein